jgi:hypothetical protein
LFLILQKHSRDLCFAHGGVSVEYSQPDLLHLNLCVIACRTEYGSCEPPLLRLWANSLLSSARA